MTRSASELRARWVAPDRHGLATEALERIAAGRQLDDLSLGSVGGLVDLRGIALEDPTHAGVLESSGAVVNRLGQLIEIRGADIVGVDFSHARLPSLRIFGSRISDARFDYSWCPDWRLWDVSIARTSFVETNLRGSALGAWFQGSGNVFTAVDFRGADFREVACPAANFIDCDFGNAKLQDIDFQSSSFVRCRFAGELRDVIFWDKGFKIDKPDLNRMEDVDFSEATLRFVEFRRLNLDKVRFPTSSDHLILEPFRCTLERAAQILDGDDSPFARRGRALLNHSLKWCGARQLVGVFHTDELGDTEEEVSRMSALLRDCSRECADSLGRPRSSI